MNYYFRTTIAVQQQHSVKIQLGHSLGELLALHSSGKQPQSAQITFINITRSAKIKTIHDRSN